MLLVSFTMKAQEEEAVVEVVEEEAPLSITGFVDVYYQYNLHNKAAGTTSFTGAHNSFELGMADIVFAKEFKKVGFVADLAFGSRANGANGVGGFTIAPIKQLYLTYSPTDAITLTAGNFATFVGYELIDAPGNYNYSVSYMFSNGPFFHTGFKADFALSKKFSAMLGIFNDTDSKTDVGGAPGKHYGAQLSYSDDKAGIFLNYLGGKADTSVTINQFDITATYQATDDLLIGLNATNKGYTFEVGNAKWFGAALYLNYAVSDAFGLGFRGEYFDDKDAAAYGISDLTFMEYTLSANFSTGALTFVPEFRIDIASDNYFTNADGNGTKNSPAFILGAYYKF